MYDVLQKASIRAYYPEYMPYERIDMDMAMMKKAGFNVIRVAESTWSTMEPKEGIFDFSYINQILDAADRYNMDVIVGTPTYAIPSWLEKKDPDIMVKTKDGRAVYGHRQIFDITNPTYLKCSERVIRKLLESVSGNPHVIGYQLDNETKHFQVSSDRVQKRFAEYLKESFRTLEELNRTFGLDYWSNAIADWDDFPDMDGCINAGLACEFEKFQRKLAADFLAWQAEIVKEYIREDQFITHNFDFEWKKFGADIAQDGYSYGVQPGINHQEASGCITLAGTDIYHPTQDDATGAEVAFGGDSIRSLKQKPYLVIETQAQAFKYWPPYPGQLRLDAFSHLASGAMGIMYWNWHSIHNSFETYWKGVLSHDLASNPAYEEICTIGVELKKLGGSKLCIQKKNEVALVVDNQSLAAMNWFPTDRNLSYNDVVRWMYDSLYEMNIECDIVDVGALETEDYRMIVIPELYSATEETIDKLRKFTANGGVLIASFRSFFANEYLSVYSDAQPHGMTECFGVSYNQFSEPGKTTVAGKKVQYFMELLNADNAEILYTYQHKYWGKYAAITRNRYGKGMAYYVGCYTEKELLKTIYQVAATDAKLNSWIFQEAWPIVCRSGINQEGKNLHYLMNYSEDIKIISCPFGSVKDLISGLHYKTGDEISLKDWDIVILEQEA